MLKAFGEAAVLERGFHDFRGAPAILADLLAHLSAELGVSLEWQAQ